MPSLSHRFSLFAIESPPIWTASECLEAAEAKSIKPTLLSVHKTSICCNVEYKDVITTRLEMWIAERRPPDKLK
jgi:hypothetical protein